MTSPNLWDEFIRHAKAIVDSGHMEGEVYKVSIADKVAEARVAVLEGDGNWPNLVKRAIGGNIVHSIQQTRFREWIGNSPQNADVLKSLRALWTREDSSVADRIRAFSSKFPASALGTGGIGTRLNLISQLLMGLDVEKYPPFRTRGFSLGYVRTLYGMPPRGADEAAVYEHALGFLDELLEQARSRGLALRHRLDAQSVVWLTYHSELWNIVNNKGGGPPVATPLPDLPPTREIITPQPWHAPPYTIDNIVAEGCFLERSRLETILARLRDKKNVILQGPPGTGKTWLAKKLAFALIGRKDDSRVRRLQFHPSLSYEDFIRGFRPGDDGGLSLIDGPFLKVVAAASADAENDYVMVIEEINRGNPAQIFGETLTLMEADKRSEEYALALAYPRSKDERVHLPSNLHIIGTMNVADRSIAMVDLALRRRFAFVDLEPTFGEVWRNWVNEQCGIPLEFLRTIERKMTALNEQIAADRSLGPQFRVGHAVVTPSPETSIDNPTEWFRRVVETEIGPLLDEYWFDPSDANKAEDARAALLADL